MQNSSGSNPSFWSTLPGILTALGGIIAACAGLITALYGAGVIGSKDKPPPNSPAVNSPNSPAVSSPTTESQSNNTNKREQPTAAEASRGFVVGRWQVEQRSGEVSGGTVMEYRADGTFGGWATTFVGGVGQRQHRAGRWDIDKLSKDTFRLKLWFDDQSTWMGTFKIIDQDHIHNVDQNYIAVRGK